AELSVDIGTDIIEIDRVEDMLQRYPAARRRIFTEQEIAYCERSARPAQHYAARFAGKESVMKVLGIKTGQGIRFRDIEIVMSADGKPTVSLHGRAHLLGEHHGIRDIRISLSHCRTYALAAAVRLP
ncbi:MAG TPA: holo-ACP synthase, partial [Thermodesulfobacteriota bacterium]|nr:holo-ACP synthase [Thermodesulfobacteriota bacterium]